MHHITVHEAAAYVVGRRGLCYKDTISLFGCSKTAVKELIFGTHDEKYEYQRLDSLECWAKLKAALTERVDGVCGKNGTPLWYWRELDPKEFNSKKLSEMLALAGESKKDDPVPW